MRLEQIILHALLTTLEDFYTQYRSWKLYFNLGAWIFGGVFLRKYIGQVTSNFKPLKHIDVKDVANLLEFCITYSQ